jgi:hypothetical protein
MGAGRQKGKLVPELISFKSLKMDPPQQVFYHDPRTLMVIQPSRKIKQLFVPIKVQCMTPVEKIPVNSWVYVVEIQHHLKYRIIYRVFDLWYPYWCFRI